MTEHDNRFKFRHEGPVLAENKEFQRQLAGAKILLRRFRELSDEVERETNVPYLTTLFEGKITETVVQLSGALSALACMERALHD